MTSKQVFDYVINQKVLEIPADIFNLNPQKAITSLMSDQCDVLYYKVNNLITNNGSLLVKIYYKMLDVSKIYLIKTADLEQYKLTSEINNVYIVNDVKITLKPIDMKKSVLPIELIPMDKPEQFSENRGNGVNYRGMIKQSTNRYFTSLTPSTAFNEHLEHNVSDAEIESMLKNIYGKVDKRLLTPESLETSMKRHLQITVNRYSSSLKKVSEIKYVDKIPDMPPNAINLAYITKYNADFKKYVYNFHIGFILAPDTRPAPDIILFIPLMNHNITEEQFANFDSNIVQDIINANEFANVM